MTKRLIDGFDGVLADLDGVVYTGRRAIDGATEALGKLADEGKRLAYVTNNASRSSADVATHLRELGAPATAEQVFGSALAGAALLAREVGAGASVLVVGSQVLADSVCAQGLVVVAASEGQPDAAVAAATDRSPLVAGKPEAALFETAARQSGVERVLVVGDRLDTDILGGNRAGMATVLVLTGVDSARTALAARVDERPNFVIGSLNELYDEYPATTADDGRYACGSASARVSGSTVHVSGREDDLDGWRAACAAWWAAHRDETPTATPEIKFAPGAGGFPIPPKR